MPKGSPLLPALVPLLYFPLPSLTEFNPPPGNVVRPYTAFKLSLRLPPNVDGKTALHALKEILEKVHSILKEMQHT